jgi:TP901 family phage tail tape measure protein
MADNTNLEMRVSLVAVADTLLKPINAAIKAFDETKKSALAAGEALAATGEAAIESGEAVAKSTDAVEDNVGALDKAEAAASDVADALKGELTPALMKTLGWVKDANGKLRDAQGRFVGAERAAKAAATGVDEFADSAKKGADAGDDLGEGVGGAGDKSEDAAKKFTLSGEAVRKLGDRMQAAARQFAIFGASLAAPLVATTKIAADFETAFTGVTKTVTASADEFEQLRQNIRDMAKEMPTTREEIAGVMEAAGQLGVRGVEGLTTFTDTALKAGVATNLTAQDFAMTAAQMLNIFGLEATKSKELGDALSFLGNTTATTESKIFDFGMRLSGTGNVMGLSVTQTLSLGASLASLGLDAEAGGTAFSQLMLRMAASTGETDDVAEAQAKLGDETAKTNRRLERMKTDLVELGQEQLILQQKDVTSAEGRAKHALETLRLNNRISELRENIAAEEDSLDQLAVAMSMAGKEANKFADVAGMTVDQFRSLVKENPEEALFRFLSGVKAMIDKDGVPAATVALEEMQLAGNRMTDAILRGSGNVAMMRQASIDASAAVKEGTALDEEARKKKEALGAQIRIVANRMTDMAITLGDVLIPKVKEFIDDYIVPGVEWLAEFVKRNDDVIGRLLIFGGVIGGLMLVLAPVLLVLGVLITTVSSLTVAIMALNAAGFVTQVAFWQVIAVAGAVAVAVAALVLVIATAWDEISEVTSVALDGILGAITWTLNSIWLLIRTPFDLLRFLWNVVTLDFEEAADVWMGIADRWAQHFIDLIAGMLSWVARLTGAVGRLIGRLGGLGAAGGAVADMASAMDRMAEIQAEADEAKAKQRAEAKASAGSKGATGGGLGVGSLIASIAGLPFLASGGIVTRPTLAMIGEGASSEAVILLDRLDSMMRKKGEGNVVFNIYNARDPKAVAHEVAHYLRSRRGS